MSYFIGKHGAKVVATSRQDDAMRVELAAFDLDDDIAEKLVRPQLVDVLQNGTARFLIERPGLLMDHIFIDSFRNVRFKPILSPSISISSSSLTEP